LAIPFLFPERAGCARRAHRRRTGKKVFKKRKMFLHFAIRFAIINKLFIWKIFKRGGAAFDGKV
jgi:hypothetical protein